MRLTLARRGVVIFVVGALVTAVAALLNARFYESYGPFYDSLSYFNQMAWVMWLAEERGILQALHAATTGSNVFLPWLLAALIAPFAQPSRLLGVMIQLPLLLLQLATAFRYFRCVPGFSEGRSLLYALSLVAFPAAFHFNGGLNDFRMDLSQAYGYGAFLAALMVARHSGTRSDWVVAGAVLAVACLVRATTPVYAVLVIGAAFLIDAYRRGLTGTLPQYLLVGGTWAFLAGWFYIINIDYLYYYYFVWNTDANARLSLSESLEHVSFLFGHIGKVLLVALLFAALVAFWSAAKACNNWKAYRLNVIALVGALVPIAFLVGSGAGLNPFVSMVAVPGLMIFLLHPVDTAGSRQLVRGSRWGPVAVAVGLTLSFAMSLKNFENDVSAWVPYRTGVAEVVRAIAEDARSRGGRARIAFLYQGSVDGQVIVNHLIFDLGGRFRQNGSVALGEMEIDILGSRFGAEAEWRAIPGDEGDQGKLAHVIREAILSADYIVMAEEGSALPMHHRVNRYADEVRLRLNDERALERIASGIVLSKTESVGLYRTNR